MLEEPGPTPGRIGEAILFCTPETFKAAMRQFPASVAIVATGSAPRRVGLAATAVCSLSAEPPQILACLNARTGTCQAIRANGCFSVNVLREGQAEIARRFAGMEKGIEGDSKFEAGRWTSGALGTPLMTQALLSFECRLLDVYEAATHLIVVGGIVALDADIEEQALMYCNGAFGTFTPLSGDGVRASA